MAIQEAFRPALTVSSSEPVNIRAARQLMEAAQDMVTDHTYGYTQLVMTETERPDGCECRITMTIEWASEGFEGTEAPTPTVPPYPAPLPPAPMRPEELITNG